MTNQKTSQTPVKKPTDSYTPVELGAYGIVVGMKGKYKGHSFYYDNEEGNCIVVYPVSADPDYFVARRTSFRAATQEETEAYEAACKECLAAADAASLTA